MDIEYTEAAKEDIEELVRMRLAYIQDDFKNVSAEDMENMKNRLPDYFNRTLGKSLVAYIAKAGSRIVATAFLNIIEMPANPNVKTILTAEVLNVFTEKQMRGQGICTTLMAMLIAGAKERGLSRIDLSATDAGYPVYKKTGFKDKVNGYKEMRLVLQPSC
ncbi:MAG: GNAT family N-acetyltransferase [Treponema sp.]|nr:GNAT family N-acetyltransferase [Treponema sp.]